MALSSSSTIPWESKTVHTNGPLGDPFTGASFTSTSQHIELDLLGRDMVTFSECSGDRTPERREAKEGKGKG